MDELIEQTVYTWEQLGEYFGFKTQYFRAAGGMIPNNHRDAMLLITHPGGAQHIDYQDYWDGEDLIYTGSGMNGDQELSNKNLKLANNELTNLLFERAGKYQLKFLGEVYSERHWWAEGPDKAGHIRKVIRFRLRFTNQQSGHGQYMTVEEGKLRLVLHKQRERDPKVVVSAKRYWLSQDSNLSCAVCNFSFVTTYGEVGKGFIEAHHRVPLASLKHDQLALTTVEDLAPVCANCHRMLHKHPYPSIDELRLRISQPSN